MIVDSAAGLLADKTLLRDQSYIDGAWVSARSEFEITDPATRKRIATVANCGAEAAEQAIQAASRSLTAWSAKTGKERAAVMKKWFELIVANAEDLARIMTLEQGKPLAESRGEIGYGASFIEWFAEEAKRVTGALPSTTWSDRRLMVMKQPVGVCASITPWNFPNSMITRKVAPALAAGCSIVIKPAEQTPLSALALAELAHRAGLPPGVLNVVIGDADHSVEIGKVLCASETVRHLSFTGSTEVGRTLMSQCAPTVKKIALELGGHAPFIVFDDSDINAAVAGAMTAKYRNAGQACVAANRFYVHSSVHDEFVEKLAAETRKIKLGNGFDDGVMQGPLIDDQAVRKVENQIAQAVESGATIVTGGRGAKLGGTYFEPTVLQGVTNAMDVARGETFGPVAPVIRFESDDEVIRLANDSPFGLASYFYSKNVSRVWKVAEALEFGMVGVNTGLFSNEVGPFGGVKQSGLGREGSSWGIDEYLEMKYVCVGI